MSANRTSIIVTINAITNKQIETISVFFVSVTPPIFIGFTSLARSAAASTVPLVFGSVTVCLALTTATTTIITIAIPTMPIAAVGRAVF